MKLTKDKEQKLEIIRHSAAHLVAQAVMELFPKTQLTIGPATKDGFFYDMLPEETSAGGTRTPADNATVRTVFIIGPDKKVKAMLMYPMSSGRNFDEVLRLVDSCQISAKHSIAAPARTSAGRAARSSISAA